jgi:molybdenum cofactor cytidylyltransferase
VDLATALGVGAGDVVAFVGAGGKTAAMFRLAGELTQRGLRVVSTTTMRVSRDELRLAPHSVAVGHGMRLPDTLADEVGAFGHVFLFAALAKDDMVRGLRPAWLSEYLIGWRGQDVMLVEADSAHRLPLKAPYTSEPGIPRGVTVVVPMVGLNALGRPLDKANVYGAELVHTTTGYRMGAPVVPLVVAAVLIHPDMGLKDVPPDARVVPLLNRVNEETLPAAREIAACALGEPRVERVLIGAVGNTDPIKEVRRRVGAVVLAAGQSVRMGRPKLLLPWGDVPLVRHVCEQVLLADPHDAVIVTGAEADEVVAAVAGLPISALHNPNYAQGGMLSSLQVGLDALWNSVDACLVVLGDQPRIEAGVIRSLVQAYYEGRGTIVVPGYEGKSGHPVLFDWAYWPELMALPPGGKPRDVVRAHQDAVYQVPVQTDSVIEDIDTIEDYRRRLRQAGLDGP